MIAALLLLLAADPVASIDGLPIGALPRQALPEKGCAAYLFTGGTTRAFAAMVAPESLRLAIEGKVIDLPRTTQDGPVAHGLSRDTEYRSGDVAATLSLTIVDRPDLTQGAAVESALLTLERAGRDVVAVPLAGLVGCKA